MWRRGDHWTSRLDTVQTTVESWQRNFAKVLQYLEKCLLEILKSSVFKCLSSSYELDEQSFKKTIEHKTVVFLGHMNDNSNFTFPITSPCTRRLSRCFEQGEGTTLGAISKYCENIPESLTSLLEPGARSSGDHVGMMDGCLISGH